MRKDGGLRLLKGSDASHGQTAAGVSGLSNKHHHHRLSCSQVPGVPLDDDDDVYYNLFSKELPLLEKLSLALPCHSVTQCFARPHDTGMLSRLKPI